MTTYATPYLLEDLGSKVGFLFGTAAVLATVFAFFCVPECKGRTLEEIDRLFLDGVPVRKFGDTQVSVLRAGDRDEHFGKGGAASVNVNVTEPEQV